MQPRRIELHRMETAGFIARRADRNDGRARRVYLTRAGAKMVNTIRDNVESVELEILSRVPEEALNQAAETLRTLKDTLLEMIGGEAEAVKHLNPVFATLAPGRGDIPRTPGREKIGGTSEQGWLHCGANGAGHFVKMVHNGIEYGVMAAYAEGLAILKAANIGKTAGAVDAETTPLRDPEHYQYDLNLPDITALWRRGSVIASWLLDLQAAALIEDPALSKFGGRVSDSGEGRWTIKAAIDEGVPAHVLSSALYERFSSRGEADFADKLLSAMRYEFGGHLEKPAKP